MIDAANPWGENFDSTTIRGPVHGAKDLYQEFVLTGLEIREINMFNKKNKVMKAKRFTAVLVMALLSVTVIVAKDLRIVVFKVPQMYCENCERKVKDNIRFEKGVKRSLPI